jgi:hypothetical protein
MTPLGLKRTVILLTVVTLAVGVFSSPALAVDRTAAEKAREHFQRGEALFKLEKFNEALGEYEQGYLAKSDATFLYNIAQCHRLMGNKPAALRFYRRFLNEATKVPNREMVEQHIRDLEKALGTSRSTPGVAAAAPQSTSPPNVATAPAVVPPPPPPPPPAPRPPPLPSSMSSSAAAGTDVAAQPPTSPDGAGGSILTRWWFWTAVGVVAAGGGVGLYLALHKNPVCEPGRTCM